jgi:GTPase SAR1 family protein
MGRASSRLSWSKKEFSAFCLGSVRAIHSDTSTDHIAAIVMIGLDDSGKTSIVNQLKERKPGYLSPTMTTIGERPTCQSEKAPLIVIIKRSEFDEALSAFCRCHDF